MDAINYLDNDNVTGIHRHTQDDILQKVADDQKALEERKQEMKRFADMFGGSRSNPGGGDPARPLVWAALIATTVIFSYL